MLARFLFCALTILVVVAWTAHADTKDILTRLNPIAGGKCSGQLTYYGAGNNNAGSCALSPSKSNALTLPAATGNRGLNTGPYAGQAITLAMNSGQFDGSQVCGMCIRFRWKGTGAGGNPPPGNKGRGDGNPWQYAIIDNLCPECPVCNIDNAMNGDGRWEVEWQAVDCPVGGSQIWFRTAAGTSPYYLKLQAYNTRVPVKLIEVMVGGSWQRGQRTVDNHFEISTAGGQFQRNMKVRVTSVLDEVVEDSISMTFGEWFGAGKEGSQFSRGVGANANRRIAVRRKPVARKPAVRKPAVKKPAAKKRVARKPVRKPGKAACKFKLYKGWQCGGRKGWCNKNTGCVDRPWKGGCCQGSRCVKKNAGTWLCR